MLLRRTLAALACALPLLVAWSPATQDDAPQDDALATDPEDVLYEAMEVLEEGLKGLRRSLRDPQAKAQSLELLDQMQAAALVCKPLVPPMAETLPEAERAKFVEAYRREMVVLVQKLLETELVVLDGDVERGREMYKELKQLEDDGHERFVEGG